MCTTRESVRDVVSIGVGSDALTASADQVTEQLIEYVDDRSQELPDEDAAPSHPPLRLTHDQAALHHALRSPFALTGDDLRRMFPEVAR